MLIGCLFHYKNALHKELSSLGLNKSEKCELSNNTLSICGTFPFIIHNNKIAMNDKLNIIIKYILNILIILMNNGSLI